MAKKCYVGVNNLAQNCSKIYVGVNNVARKVVKGYVGVNGIAQQFWGSGDSLIFEYDYQDNTIYSIHNYLTLEDVLTACYNEFIKRYGSQDAEFVYLINNWQTIKSDIITTAENTGYNIQNIRVAIRHETSGSTPYIDITVWYGDDTFPKNVKTSTYCKRTDSFGNIYYILLSKNEAPSTPPPQGDYWFTTAIFGSYYRVNTLQRPASVNMSYIGLYSGTAVPEINMSNFGMKKQNT